MRIGSDVGYDSYPNPSYRPQSNSMIERDGKETSYHLRAAVMVGSFAGSFRVVYIDNGPRYHGIKNPST